MDFKTRAASAAIWAAAYEPHKGTHHFYAINFGLEELALAIAVEDGDIYRRKPARMPTTPAELYNLYDSLTEEALRQHASDRQAVEDINVMLGEATAITSITKLADMIRVRLNSKPDPDPEPEANNIESLTKSGSGTDYEITKRLQDPEEFARMINGEWIEHEREEHCVGVIPGGVNPTPEAIAEAQAEATRINKVSATRRDLELDPVFFDQAEAFDREPTLAEHHEDEAESAKADEAAR